MTSVINAYKISLTIDLEIWDEALPYTFFKNRKLIRYTLYANCVTFDILILFIVCLSTSITEIAFQQCHKPSLLFELISPKVVYK